MFQRLMNLIRGFFGLFISGLEKQNPEALLEVVKATFNDLPPGLTYLITHPALDTPELRASVSDWRERVANYQVFRSAQLNDYVKRTGIQVIGWRPIRRLMPRSFK